MNSMYFKDITIINENFDAEDHMNVLTENGKIRYIGKEDRNFEGAIVYSGKNKLLMPGFYNLHCHVPMTLLRGYGEGLPLQVWLFDKMIPFEAKLSDEDIYWATLHGSMEMIRSGVISFSDMYFAIDRVSEAVLETGLKANICHGLTPTNESSHLKGTKGYRDTEALWERFKNTKNSKIKVDCGLHSEYTTNESFVREIAEYAKERSMIVHTHISETKREHEECKERHGLTPTAYFKKLGLLDSPSILAHGVWLEDKDIEILSLCDSTVVHNASSNLKLGSGFCNIKKLLEKNINVAIGTDGAASNNNLNMIEEIHLSSMLQKGINLDAEFMNAKQTLKIATQSGAIAQKREKSGLIKEGYSADLIVIDMDKPHLQPVFDYAANIVFSAEASDVVLNMVDGEVIYKDGTFKHLDTERIVYEVVKIKNRIMKSFNSL